MIMERLLKLLTRSDVAKIDQENANLHHRLVSEATGLRRATQIAARTAVFEEMLRGQAHPNDNH